ncbi:hypothetical protein sos41_09310 [Alphaproteobacteria bacterium SO-S41]|nr:hypothetical protein sos41_09310 [Alphaproteobacteria bacterium SO-S41]
MTRRYYPAVLERGAKGALGLWFPDFPDAVAAGASNEAVMQRGEEVLRRAVEKHAERDLPLPAATSIEAIVLPKNCPFVAFVVIGVDPPDASERVNVYLPRSLIARIDSRAAELGMSRSSFFGLAATTALEAFGAGHGFSAIAAWWSGRSEAEKTAMLQHPIARKRLGG